MKSRLALLAVPFLALACTDAEQATLLEPPAISADVTTEAAPIDGGISVEVKFPWSGCGTMATNPAGGVAVNQPFVPASSWELNGTGDPFACIEVTVTAGGVNLNKGTVSYQLCAIKQGGGSGPLPSASCAVGAGKWVTYRKESVVSGFSRAC